MPRPYGRFRLRLAAVALSLPLTLLPLLGVSAVPAVAGPDPQPHQGVPPSATVPAPLLPERGSAYMGVGVMAHEGSSGSPEPLSPATRASQTEGVDVSSHQREVAWPTLWSAGTRWAYTKATEGTSYRNPYYDQHYDGAHGVGMVRGAYHFATPDSSGGSAQADYFIDHGGGWTGDGHTLPGALDIEYNPYGDTCYGKSNSSMVSWIGDFLGRYKERTGRDAVIYTSTNWWNQCTGGHRGFGATNPLWVARYASSVGTLPAGWSSYAMWQYTSTGPTVGDHDRFDGTVDGLRDFAAA
ncbi:lysozyme [Streptomyces griseoviridis]|uniref:lysozyme n=1 Tax=Streptomyces griseoviridis TaxID=45398 RepID=UPI0033E00CF1